MIDEEIVAPFDGGLVAEDIGHFERLRCMLACLGRRERWSSLLPCEGRSYPWTTRSLTFLSLATRPKYVESLKLYSQGPIGTGSPDACQLHAFLSDASALLTIFSVKIADSGRKGSMVDLPELPDGCEICLPRTCNSSLRDKEIP